MSSDSAQEETPLQRVEEIFPFEIWSKILSEVKSAKDLISFSTATKDWSDLLERDKTSFFMEVIFPHISDYLKPSDSLTCRRVCKRWKNGVDNFLQYHPAHFDIGNLSRPHFTNTTPPTLPSLCLRRQYRSTQDHRLRRLYPIGNDNNLNINAFTLMHYLKYHEDYPWVYAAQRCISGQRATLIDLVTKFGSDIWHFDLFLSEKGLGQHKVIRRCLSLMPNLKTVSIFVDSGIKNNFTIPPSGPITTLGNVVRLSTNVEGILNLGGSRMLNSIQILFTDNLFKNMEMKGLEQLHVVVMNNDDLDNVYKLDCPLKILKIQGKNYNPTMRLSTLFVAVSSFGQTLKEFTLEQYVGEEVKSRLELPLLEKFFMDVGNYRMKSVDFLVPCVCLKHMYLECAAISFEEECQLGAGGSSNSSGERVGIHSEIYPPVIQFHGFENSMYESNIWEILPKLQSIDIKGAQRYRYKREDYLIHKKSKTASEVNENEMLKGVIIVYIFTALLCGLIFT